MALGTDDGSGSMAISTDDGSGSSKGGGGDSGKGDGSSGSSSGGGFNPVFLLALMGGAVFLCLEINKRFIAPAQQPATKSCCSGKSS
jgi:hypothetical protein